MKIQIALVLFIAFCAASAGIFATQAILALKEEEKEIQLPSLVASFIALVIGGVSVLFHLAQPLHIFNGFGNPTSGITQELVVIVVLVIVMLVYFILLRRNDGQIPAWCCIVAIAVSAVLDIVCAHSYMMPSRPAWDSVLQVLTVIGGSCAVGPAAVAALAGFKKIELKNAGILTVAGTAAGLVFTVIYLIFLCVVGGSFATVGTYIDPTNPTAALFNASSVNPFSAGVIFPTIVSIVGAAAALFFAAVGRKKGSWKANGTAALIAALISVIALRIVFYLLGASVYNFYGITG